jgi:hypothetical protein
VSHQLAALSMLRDFTLALSRAAAETEAKKAEAAKQAARKLKRAGIAVAASLRLAHARRAAAEDAQPEQGLEQGAPGEVRAAPATCDDAPPVAPREAWASADEESAQPASSAVSAAVCESPMRDYDDDFYF